MNSVMLNFKQLFFLTFLVIIFAGEVLNVQAQRACLPINYRDLPYWSANFVFTGVVEKFTADKQAVLAASQITISDTYTPVHNLVKLAVEKNYRGNTGKTIEIISSFNFKEGERYFIYALPSKDGKIYQLDDGECGKPPILLKDAKDDIEYAEEIAAGKLGTRIYGSVTQSALGTLQQIFPLAEIEVTIKSKKYTFTTKTDSDGKYIFKNIPIGKYEITAKIPPGMHEKEFLPDFISGRIKLHKVFVGKGFAADNFITIGSSEKPKPYFYHSAAYNFQFSAQSSIKGKLTDFDGKVPPQQYVWLVPIINGKAALDSYTQYLWTNPADGKFVFKDIPKGEYTIVVNRYNCHSNNHPEYSRNFFSGVSEENNADIIRVGENQNIKIKDFRLSAQLKERWFSGVVLSANKTPLANATVFLTNSNQKNPNECFSINIETKTDELGRFKLKGYEGYEYKIRAYIQTNEQNSARLFSKILEIPTNDSIENIEMIVDSNY